MAEVKKKTNETVETKTTTTPVPAASKVAPAATTSTGKAEVKPEPKKEEPKKEAPKKAEPKKATATKTAKKTTKKTTKRGPKPASERTIELQIQFGEKNDVTYSNLVSNVKDWWKNDQGKRETSLKSINIYVKPEDSMAYCIINDKVEYNIDLSEWN